MILHGSGRLLPCPQGADSTGSIHPRLAGSGPLGRVLRTGGMGRSPEGGREERSLGMSFLLPPYFGALSLGTNATSLGACVDLFSKFPALSALQSHRLPPRPPVALGMAMAPGCC